MMRRPPVLIRQLSVASTETPVAHTDTLDGSTPPPDLSSLRRLEPDEIIPRLVQYAAAVRASDLYLYSNEREMEFAIRHLGIVRPLGSVPIELGRRCLLFVKNIADMNISERRRPLEGRWVLSRPGQLALDLRSSTIPSLYGEDCTIRILDQARALLSLDQLGLNAYQFGQVCQLLSSPSGLILVTGPTESGKTTMMYAGLAYLNTGARKINTIEDPIEYSLKGIRQSQAHAHGGPGEVSFSELLRGVLRQAPDVIMVGEVREEETALTAVRAAATGHLVKTTLHAPIAAAAVHSMFRLGVPPRSLSQALVGIVSQRLVRTLCSACKVEHRFPTGPAFEAVRQWLDPKLTPKIFAPVGCPACHMTGFAGRTGLFEVLVTTSAVRALVDEAAPVAEIRAVAVKEGMMEFRHSALLKVASGITCLEEIARVLPQEFLSAPK